MRMKALAAARRATHGEEARNNERRQIIEESWSELGGEPKKMKARKEGRMFRRCGSEGTQGPVGEETDHKSEFLSADFTSITGHRLCALSAALDRC